MALQQLRQSGAVASASGRQQALRLSGVVDGVAVHRMSVPDFNPPITDPFRPETRSIFDFEIEVEKNPGISVESVSLREELALEAACAPAAPRLANNTAIRSETDDHGN